MVDSSRNDDYCAHKFCNVSHGISESLLEFMISSESLTCNLYRLAWVDYGRRQDENKIADHDLQSTDYWSLDIAPNLI